MNFGINHNLMAMNVSRNLGNHYQELGVSTRRLSSGLRIGTAADDAAGLAVRELMRSDVSTLNQGVRNANDAISMIQTADGALEIIDEKLIRMKELAEQAATGTYSSDQRVIIDSEFQAMALEVQRISNSTDFNGVKLLNGNLSGVYDGTGLNQHGAMNIHFGSGNNAAEDYYDISIKGSRLQDLGLATTMPETIQSIDSLYKNDEWKYFIQSGLTPIGFIPKGTTDIVITFSSAKDAAFWGGTIIPDDIEIFTRDGKHLLGTPLNNIAWNSNSIDSTNIGQQFLTETNGFLPGASYDSTNLNSGGPNYQQSAANINYYNGMKLGYGGDANWTGSAPEVINNALNETYTYQYATIDVASEDLLVFGVGIPIVGGNWFSEKIKWGSMPSLTSYADMGIRVVNIKTQDSAQAALSSIDGAIVSKDKLRASLGSSQNRLENTISNLQIQAENLQDAESQISDVDVAGEMTNFVKEQILSQAATAMLAQANSIPKMAVQLISGG